MPVSVFGGLVAAMLIAHGFGVVSVRTDSDCFDLDGVEFSACLHEEGWHEVQEADGIRVYSRSTPDTRVHEVMAFGIIEVRPQDVLQVIVDYEAYPAFMPYVIESRVLREDAGTRWVFQQLDFPWPIHDRYYTIRLTEGTTHPWRHHIVKWRLATQARHHRPGKGTPTVRNEGFWVLQPRTDGAHTRVIYTILVDPGGRLPAWLVNRGNAVAVPRVIEAVRKRAERARQ